MEGIKTADDILRDAHQEEGHTTTALDNLADNRQSGHNPSPKTPREHFIDANKTIIKDEDLSMFPKPRSGCRHCNGGGSEGWNLSRQEIVLCRCIRNRIFKELHEDRLLTYREIKEIYNAPRRARGLPDIDDKSVQEESKEAV